MSFVEEKLLPQVLRVHDTVYRKTNGWIGHRTLWIPSLLLHTVGAKTGKPRTTSLTYARDGENYLVVASKGGAPEAPGWYHNLKAKPEAEINVGPKRFAVTARIVPPGDADYARFWEIVNKNNQNRYAEYQKRTSRPIPVVVLTPKS
ncbi:nitroreductase family deazaflavin-dependent oxidoreductase [Mycobacterium avium subsp. hominissuis]|uniref:nitroreductase family deazaflavin-dependent oxidoreductase n=1 Tax=Mycobacterium avium TaxID=1764 RepID=UPI001D7BDEE6|nr:nitroreductase family deazaflavin-dependent oxidoreductase [Mycobacterium avium]MBZ4561709.1 nitroreductase family deazaflavin-dependent oxidoreductase [Mycobacterium avium subsp. hominissuis]MBZ4570816.1 nitroreductase family deazaflavin-dependent oxidoreductase [Mycobacterium avium subsp. hominissuis]MBZ4590145.1 nitroreductase family deazaflavin-dependent oxidoreductase [Mycobacterium avium subsp. hominissuis]MBZ4624769.1 nitroreductase family deazaflavin-dependent oxidoreductase [Mycobac